MSYIAVSNIKAPVNNDHISIDSDDEDSSMEVKASNVSKFLQQSDGGNDMSENCNVSDDNDSKEKINQSVASDVNELDDDIEDDGKMSPDVGKILRRIYNCEINCANLRKRGQETLVYILTDAAERDEFIQDPKD